MDSDRSSSEEPEVELYEDEDDEEEGRNKKLEPISIESVKLLSTGDRLDSSRSIQPYSIALAF